MTRIIRDDKRGNIIQEDVPDGYVNTGNLLVPTGQQTIRRGRRKGRWMAQLEGSAGPANPWPADYALAMDFKNGSYWREGVNIPDLTQVSDYAYSRTGAYLIRNNEGAYQEIASGALPIISGKGLHCGGNYRINRLHNAGSATPLVSHTANVPAGGFSGVYTLSFVGTGSITLSGATTLTLNGTGENVRVAALTPSITSGNITVTVTGDVRYAQLNHGTFLTNAASDWCIPSGASASSIGISSLRMGVNPILTDTDFIWWAAINVDTAFNDLSGSGFEGASQIIGTASFNYIGRNSGSHVSYWNGVTNNTGTNMGIGRHIVGCRRRAGKMTGFRKTASGSVTQQTEAASTSTFTLTERMFFGLINSGDALDGYLEFVGMRRATLDNAQLNTFAGTL
jgi:hypothetical protein